MILISIFLAVTTGLLVGMLAQIVSGRRATAPSPLTVVVATVATLLGALAAHLTGSTGFGRFALPALLAMVAVGVIVMVTPGTGRDGRLRRRSGPTGRAAIPDERP